MEFSSFLCGSELDDGFYIFPCDAMSSPCCVVPNIPMLSWEESRGDRKKRDRREMAREAKLQPALGGYFTVRPLNDWADWFTETVIFDREDEEDEEDEGLEDEEAE